MYKIKIIIDSPPPGTKTQRWRFLR